MRMTFDQLWPLLLLLALVPLVWSRRRSLIEFHPRQLDLMMVTRCTALILVVLAMMQPTLHRTGDWSAVVYLLDVSRSVEPQAVSDSIDWIDDAETTSPSDAATFIAFGANAARVDDAQSLRSVRVADGAGAGAVDRSATNLQAALERGFAALPPYHVPRIVLLSDGNATAGELESAIEHLQIEGVAVDTRPISAREGQDTWVEVLDIAADVTAGLPFPLELAVHSQIEGRANLVVRNGDEVLVSEPVELLPGSRQLLLFPMVEEAGAANLEVMLAYSADPEPDNNIVELALRVRPRPRVLYVEGVQDSTEYLTAALEDGGFDVEVIAPVRLPVRAGDFDRFEAVILSDVLPELITPATMRALRTYVEELGGGLLLAGGESVYGEEGYAETVIEEIMPVWFKAEREPKDLALVIALDKSYSMVGDKMALAKEASKAALDLMEEEQQFGLLAFDYHFYWPVPIQEAVPNRASIAERIASIEASSPTNIYPALQDVFVSLQAVDAEVKHVILLSDGKTYEDDYEGLAKDMVEQEITVSTVAVGDKADRELLSNIAEWGEGRSYYIADPTRVPQVFVDETQLAQGVTIEEGDDVVPTIRKSVEAFAGLDMETVPALLGYVRTMAKDNAEIILETEEEDPILARWQFGLGRSTLFASDVKNRWAVNWLDWDGYGKFWVQLVRETMRQREWQEPEFRVVRAEGRARLTLDAIDARGGLRNALRPQVEMVVDGGEPEQLELAQVAPGRYAATVALANDQAAAFRWQDQDEDVAPIERALLPVASAESLPRATDTALLGTIADRTGGRFDPAPGARRSGARVERPTRLWLPLAVLALLFYLANLLLRRVRLFGGSEWASV